LPLRRGLSRSRSPLRHLPTASPSWVPFAEPSDPRARADCPHWVWSRAGDGHVRSRTFNLTIANGGFGHPCRVIREEMVKVWSVLATPSGMRSVRPKGSTSILGRRTEHIELYTSHGVDQLGTVPHAIEESQLVDQRGTIVSVTRLVLMAARDRRASEGGFFRGPGTAITFRECSRCCWSQCRSDWTT